MIGYETCPRCAGRGLLARSDDNTTNRRRNTGVICPTCHRCKKLPIISIEGFLPDVDTLTLTRETAATPGMPFELRPVADTGT